MRRFIFICCPLVLMFLFSGFDYWFSSIAVPDELIVKEPLLVAYPENEILCDEIELTPPFAGNAFIGFKEALAFTESRGNYFVINSYGYLGKYQFGKGTLALMGVTDTNLFLNNPALQEKVFYTNISRNKWILRRYIKGYEGRRIKGIKITESGLLAAAHLGGPGNVIKYLKSHGARDVKDGYGTKISKYMRKFAGFDTSKVKAKRNPKV